MKNKTKICLAAPLIAFALVVSYASITFHEDATANELIVSLLVHFSMVAVLALWGLDLPHPFRLPGWKKTVWLFPCLLVVLNNLPFLALLDGRATIVKPQFLPLLFLQALSVGIFEEWLFRGVLFPYFYGTYAKDKKSRFWVIVVSSAVFGLMHLLNLAEGAGIGTTLMQVGYSFLVGGMCTIVLLYTENILFPILLHTLFDFCGTILPTLSEGTWWDTPTVLWTAALALLTATHLLFTLQKLPFQQKQK